MGANSYVCRSHRGKTGSRVKQFEADHIPSTFLKALFHKFYLVLSWILCTTWSMNFFLVILIMKSLDNECVLLGTLRKFKDSFFYRTLLVAASRLTKVRQTFFLSGAITETSHNCKSPTRRSEDLNPFRIYVLTLSNEVLQ